MSVCIHDIGDIVINGLRSLASGSGDGSVMMKAMTAKELVYIRSLRQRFLRRSSDAA